MNIFLPIILAYIIGAQKNSLIETVYSEYQQHMFWLRNKLIIFLVHTLNKRPDLRFLLLDISIVIRNWSVWNTEP